MIVITCYAWVALYDMPCRRTRKARHIRNCSGPVSKSESKSWLLQKYEGLKNPCWASTAVVSGFFNNWEAIPLVTVPKNSIPANRIVPGHISNSIMSDVTVQIVWRITTSERMLYRVSCEDWHFHTIKNYLSGIFIRQHCETTLGWYCRGTKVDRCFVALFWNRSAGIPWQQEW